jgi:hypothetical protein
METAWADTGVVRLAKKIVGPSEERLDRGAVQLGRAVVGCAGY